MNLLDLYSKAKKPDVGGGIMYHLPDLGVSRAPFYNKSIIAGTSDGFTPSDHGTMIAGILFDWCPKAALASYRVASDVDPLLTNGGRLLDAFDRIIQTVERYTAYRHIVSVSQATDNLGEIQLERFHGQIRELATMGALVVCAAGNDGASEVIKYPAAWTEPVCVTACNAAGDRALFSTVTGEADCCALGVNVQGIDAAGRPCTMSGTSFAAPQVAGMAGMIWQQGMTADDVWRAIRAACVDMGPGGCDPYYGWGVVDPTKLTAAEVAEKEEPNMNFKRTLRMGSKGEDVFYIKQRLLTLGYFSDKIKKISSKTFGKDTHNAVKLFQSENVDASGKRLDMDGIIGKLTWASIEAATVKEEPKEAAPFSAAGLVAYVKTKLGNPYVWGGHGQVNPSNAKMKAMETSTANYNRVLAFIAKQKRAGMKDFEIFDCSGLISRYLFDHGKVPGKRNCRHLGSMCVKVNKRKAGEDITRFLAPGDLMFRHSVYLHHVGVYIGGGMVAEAKGRDDGVVIRDINANGAGYWNRYGRLKIFA